MSTIALVFVVLALVLAAIEQIRAQGKSLVAWAVILLALIPLLGLVGAR